MRIELQVTPEQLEKLVAGIPERDRNREVFVQDDHQVLLIDDGGGMAIAECYDHIAAHRIQAITEVMRHNIQAGTVKIKGDQ